MTKLKIIPTSHNGVNLELYENDKLTGILECLTDGKTLYILGRENQDFFDFTVESTIYEQGKMPETKVLAKTNNLKLEMCCTPTEQVKKQ